MFSAHSSRMGYRGWRYAARLLEAHGAEPLTEREDSATWLDKWLPKLTRRQRHGGNLTYAWALERGGRRHLPESRPYPKLTQLSLG